MGGRASVRVVELRVLEGPNLYFTRPAIKLTLAVPGWLTANEDRAAELARRMGLPSSARPGAPRSEHRRRFVARLAAHVTRSLAGAAGSRIGVRSRPGAEPERIVVAYPWRRRTAAEALGREVADVLGAALRARRPFRALLRERAARLSRVDEPGAGASVPVPHVPVIAVTGTNGKTTTVRLLAHLFAEAGRTVAYTSTDGVYLNGRLVEEGDYSGPSGAGMALSERGRGIAPIDGRLSLLRPGPSIVPLMPLEDVPVTLAGISSVHVQNAMAAAAAALGAGLRREDVVRGLRSFVLDPERNPGRANLFEDRGRVVVIDYAHNEAGMEGLVEIGRGLRAPGAEVWIAFCSAGDRSDDIMHAVGYRAARGADRVAVVELRRYLRGRDPEDVVDRLRAGAIDGGATDVPEFPDEVAGLEWMLEHARENDVVAIAALSKRQELFELLRSRGATRIDPARCRQLARRARGGL